MSSSSRVTKPAKRIGSPPPANTRCPPPALPASEEYGCHLVSRATLRPDNLRVPAGSQVIAMRVRLLFFLCTILAFAQTAQQPPKNQQRDLKVEKLDTVPAGPTKPLEI